jgi:hypothetical protein
VQNIEQQKQQLYQSLANDSTVPPERREAIQRDLDQLTSNAAVNIPAAAFRRTFGFGDEKTQAKDRLLTDTAWEGAKSYVHLNGRLPQKDQSAVDYLKTKLTPGQYVTSAAADTSLKTLVPKPDPINYAKGAVDDFKTAFPDLDLADAKKVVAQKADEYYGIKLPGSAQSPKPTPTPLPVVPTVEPPAGSQTFIPGSGPLTRPATTDNRNQAILAILTLLAGVGGGGMLARSLRRRKRRPTRELYESELA